MKRFVFYFAVIALLSACNNDQSQNPATENSAPLEQQETPRSLSGDKPYEGANPHANLSAEQHVEVAKQHFEQGRPVEAQEVLNSAGAGAGWQGDIISLVSAKLFKSAGERMKEYCVEGKNSEVCLILASAYFEGEANFGIHSKDIVEAYRYTKYACDYGSEAACAGSNAAIEKGELLQNVLYEPGVENRDAQVKKAIQLGADVNATPLFTATLLQQAISKEKVEAVELLLENGADVNYRVSEEDPTPLMYAINSAQKEMVTLLLENGADPGQTMKAADYLKMEKSEVNACDFANKLENQEMMALLKCADATASDG